MNRTWNRTLTTYAFTFFTLIGLIASNIGFAFAQDGVGRKKANRSALSSLAAGTYDPFFATQATVADFGVTTRPFGVAAGDFNGDGRTDAVVGRTTGNIAFVRGNGDGTFAAPTVFAWKQTTFNAWAYAPGDVNGDGKLDVIWGANATSTGCSVSPVPSTGCPLTVTVTDGDVRAFLGNGDGTFQENVYFVSGVRHNAGVLLGRVGSASAADAGSVAAGDLDNDGDIDIVAGGIDGANSVVKILRNSAGVFTQETLISQAAGCSTTPAGTTPQVTCSPTYFPVSSAQNSPWGLAIGDADGDGDKDLFVGDRALYIYLYVNTAGTFAMKTGNTAVSGRPNAYLGHDTFRAAVGFTPSLAAGDVNGDGKADVFLGLHSGTQNPAAGTVNDGSILLDVSTASGHSGFGPLADIGTMARGVSTADVNGDGSLDVLAGEYDGKIKLLRQLPPLDADGDGISDYVDNAPFDANAPRIDMNTDGTINYRDQLDNDFDTVLGDPENSSTWVRMGDIVDPDDDNDGVADTADKCQFVADADQADKDGDGMGDACDPLDNTDTDGDGVPNGPSPGDPLYEASRAAKIKWSQGNTHFVIRIDALGRFFQNEFTQLMTDAAVLSPADWAAKCWENYDPGDVSATYEPCGDDSTKTLTLDGGKEVPVTVVVIPKQLWTDPPVINWINDRNDNPRFDLGQHGTYHASNTMNGDWATLTDRNFFSCEACGLTYAESLQLLNVGKGALTGDYGNKWIAESGATAGAPKINWLASANPLISYAPPFNTSDELARRATAELGFKSFSASVHEEFGGGIGQFFSPTEDAFEKFDKFGMFHASADLEFEPPETSAGAYSPSAYQQYLEENTQPGQLNTWLIEEVEWSGRPCNDDPRLTNTGGNAPASCTPDTSDNNRENNTVYGPRWQGWMQLLDYVKNYPGGVAMTMGEVALAKGMDNAPTVPNPDQADSDSDGIGDVIDGAAIVAGDASLSRNVPGTLSATLANGGNAIAGQTVTFAFDTDGDTVAETFTGTTNASGVATVTVTATRPVGTATFEVSWNGGEASATDTGSVNIADATTLTMGTNPSSGQVTDAVTVSATLTDSDGNAVAGQTITFAIGSASGSGVTGANGTATATLTLSAPVGATTLMASFAGSGPLGASSASSAFTVLAEDTVLTLSDAVAVKNNAAVATAVLKEQDGAPLQGRTISFYTDEKVRGSTVQVLMGTAVTNAAGTATFTIPTKYVSKTQRAFSAVFAGDGSFTGSAATAVTYRQ